MTFGTIKKLSALAILAALAACSTAGEPTRYQLSKTQPADAAKPVPAASAEAPVPTGPFGRWAAVVIAADNKAGNGRPTAAFDNARRDVSLALAQAGFAPQHIRQFTVKPEATDPTTPTRITEDSLRGAMHHMLASAGEGCLYYFTTHGDKTGIVFGRDKLKPDQMASLVERTCGMRPTIVIVSACHSGVFVPAVAHPNRMVFAAAHADRSSFGCGESSRYPYFDQCTIESLPASQNFLDLVGRVQGCVSRMEQAEGYTPSQPQIFVGTEIVSILQQKSFAK